MLADGTRPPFGSTDIGAAVDKWRIERNAIVHSLTKSVPGSPTAPLLPFIQRAQIAVDDGVILAKAVSKWHKKQLALYRKR